MMRIQIAGLSEGIHGYHFETTAGDLALGDQFAGPVTVDAKLDKGNSQIVLRAHIRAVSNVECDRCITPFALTLTPSLQMHYVWNEPDSAGYDPSEVQVISSGLSVITMDEDVRQTVLLAVPLKNVCRDQCKGLCPRCGKNLNDGLCSCEASENDTPWDRFRSAASRDDEIE